MIRVIPNEFSTLFDAHIVFIYVQPSVSQKLSLNSVYVFFSEGTGS